VNIPFALNNFGQPSFLMNENYRITPAIMLLTKRLSNSLFLAEFKGCHIPECRIISDYCQCSYRRAFQQRFLRLLSYFPSLASMAELSYIDMKVGAQAYRMAWETLCAGQSPLQDWLVKPKYLQSFNCRLPGSQKL
jgi:hypothetical protein